jgi:hypothetical protein
MGKYFTIEELCSTSTGLDNTPNEEEIKHLEELMEVLDDIREAWGSAIRVNSGFRSEAVNKAIGGSKTSEHRLGYAVDIEPNNQKNKEFWDFIVDYVKTKNINFSQLINEKPKCGVPSWIHFSINGLKGYRKQIFTLV